MATTNRGAARASKVIRQGMIQDSSRARRIEVKVKIARSSTELTALGEKLRGKALRFRDTLDFDRDGIDGLLQLFELQILCAGALELLRLSLNATNETDCDSGQ
jgi:hypothetical protein